MHTFLHSDYESLSNHAARMMHRQVLEKPAAVIALAAGESPRRAYQQFVALLLATRTDYSQCTIVALDEWVGIDVSNPGSCFYFLTQNIVRPLGLRVDRYRLFNGTLPDPAAQGEAMNRFIAERGGLDMIVVGIGVNGHIGFNEPGTPADLYAHVAKLDSSTTAVGQKYFAEQTVLEEGITLGLKHFLEADKALLLASGARKAGIIKRALEQTPSPDVPASVIQKHNGGYVLLDRDAASELTSVKFSSFS